MIIDPDEKYSEQLAALAEETQIGIEFLHAPDFKRATEVLSERYPASAQATAGGPAGVSATVGGPDAIVLGLEGEPLFQAIHGLKPAGANYPAAPVVALVREAGADGGLAAIVAGAQDVLTKGKTDIHRLARSLRFAVERHRMVGDFRVAEEMAVKIKHILSDLIAHSRDGILIVSESGSVHLANENALRLLGDGESRLENVSLPIDPSKLALLPGANAARSHIDVHLAATRWGDDRSTIVFLREK